MEELIIIGISILVCVGAAYKWSKYVEAIAESTITLKGTELKRIIPKQTSIDG